MKHPFQRASNDKDTVRTPFQAAVVRYIRAYSKDGQRMSGRKLSSLLGKSANHISQMLNDGFVPSGPAILEMADVLALDDADRDRLILAAMETKASQRSRDNFWINQTWRMLEEAAQAQQRFERFLAERDLTRDYEAWSRRKGRTKPKRASKA